jgi:secreted trypsin-like serine protease
MKALSCVAIGLLAVGCAAESAGTRESVDDNEIIGGTEWAGDPAIVALYGKKPGEEKGMLCTSTLIAPTVLLTAAHCVDPAVVGEGLVYTALLGAKLTDQANPSPRIPVRSTHFDPQFDKNQLMNGHDIAVAILETPHTAAPMPWNRNPLPDSLVGTQIRVVGYGLNDGFQQTGAGIKRQHRIKVNGIDNLFVKTGSFGGTICSGDSGGPVLANINGVETVIAVNSFGMIYCIHEANSTNTATYASFVDQYLPH